MARIQHVKKAQQRYAMRPVLDDQGQQVQTPVMNPRTGEQKVTKSGRPVFQKQTVRDYDKPLPMPRCDFAGCEHPDRRIAVGQAYKIAPVKSGSKYRHEEHPAWQPWELSSAMWARVAQAVDAGETSLEALDDFEEVDDVVSVLQEVADEIRGLAEEREEAAGNIEDGFGHETEMSANLREHADNLNSFADDLESWSADEDAPDPGDFDCDEDGEELEDPSALDDDQRFNSEGMDLDTAWTDWREAVLDSARSALQETPEV